MFEVVATTNALLSRKLTFCFLKKSLVFFVFASLLLKLNLRHSKLKKYHHY